MYWATLPECSSLAVSSTNNGSLERYRLKNKPIIRVDTPIVGIAHSMDSPIVAPTAILAVSA